MNELKPSQKVFAAKQLQENPLLQSILQQIEERAVTTAINATDEILRAEACYKARAIRSFRDELTTIIVVNSSGKGDGE